MAARSVAAKRARRKGAEHCLIRGARSNQGVLLNHMINSGADALGDMSQSYCAAIDTRRNDTGTFSRRARNFV
jgi:hypothetical protein